MKKLSQYLFLILFVLYLSLSSTITSALETYNDQSSQLIKCPTNNETIECSGYGICNYETTTCKCDSTHFSYDCSVPKCYSKGCAPHIDSVIPTRMSGGEITLNGYFGDDISHVSVGGYSRCSSETIIVTPNSIKCILGNNRYYYGYTDSLTVSYQQQIVDVNTTQTTTKYIDLTIPYTPCNDTSQGVDCLLPYIDCPAHPYRCNGQGECNNQLGKCLCFDYSKYQGDQCDVKIMECPTNNQTLECSGYGKCNNQLGVCECILGRSNKDCSEINNGNTDNWSYITSITPTSINGKNIVLNGWFPYYKENYVEIGIYQFNTAVTEPFKIIGYCLPNNEIKSTDSIKCTIEMSYEIDNYNIFTNDSVIKIRVLFFIRQQSSDTITEPFYEAILTTYKPCDADHQGVDCLLPYIGCPVAPHYKMNTAIDHFPTGECSDSGSESCNTLIGECNCKQDSFNKTMLGQDCSIANHTISSVISPNYIGEYVSIYGFFGYTYLNQSITIGGTNNCTIISSKYYWIGCMPQQPLQSGNQTITLYQNGINFTTTALFEQQCPKGNDIRDSNHHYQTIGYSYDAYKSCSGIGSCNQGRCDCSAYVPFQGRSNWKGDDCSIPNITIISIEPCKFDGGRVVIYVNDFSYLIKPFILTIKIGDQDCHVYSQSPAQSKNNQLEIICNIKDDRGSNVDNPVGFQTLSIYKDDVMIYSNSTIFKYDYYQCPNNCTSIDNRGQCNIFTGECKCNDNLEIDHIPSDCSVKCSHTGCTSHLDSVDSVSVLGGTVILYGYFDSSKYFYYAVYIDNEFVRKKKFNSTSHNDGIKTSETQIKVQAPPKPIGNYNVYVIGSNDFYGKEYNYYSRIILDGFTIEYTAANSCPGQCTGISYGICNETTSKCECNENYVGDDCSTDISTNDVTDSTTKSLPTLLLIAILIVLLVITLLTTYFKKN